MLPVLKRRFPGGSIGRALKANSRGQFNALAGVSMLFQHIMSKVHTNFNTKAILLSVVILTSILYSDSLTILKDSIYLLCLC